METGLPEPYPQGWWAVVIDVSYHLMQPPPDPCMTVTETITQLQQELFYPVLSCHTWLSAALTISQSLGRCSFC